MKDRIKAIRKEFNLTQQDFAERLSITRGALANYEIGRNIPAASVVSLICREFHVSEDWLRTGEGEMLVPVDPDDKAAQLFGHIMVSASPSKKATLRMLMQLMELATDEQWEAIMAEYRKALGFPE